MRYAQENNRLAQGKTIGGQMKNALKNRQISQDSGQFSYGIMRVETTAF